MPPGPQCANGDPHPGEQVDNPEKRLEPEGRAGKEAGYRPRSIARTGTRRLNCTNSTAPITRSPRVESASAEVARHMRR